ncbi:unnamed protein product [[Actinomadura] parvosata subsp. kistnae]|uniref:Photosystem reaction center subunit H n=1 Tax=[Actinomadura] parvosata subsp. kistnae TaxID=1909395 RepID=A0A1V0A239_9ACTN|nr:PRC and DUF2382 domain-containing protein [Nonomuraea sp. ATCC 55076]AQZ64274.1 hypothetical protein BKM31_24950 [Nonomuraea sp. ATCC 55076]SPM00121.1 unnamed protein product [Actinomadura parvosata subsp. kistnae]
MQTEIRSLLDCHVVGSDGQSIGKVGQVYLNDHTGEPEWVTVRTGFFGMKQTFVPLANSRRTGEEIRVPFDKEMIKEAPNIDVDDRLSLKEEADLYRYYGMQPTDIPRQRTGETSMRGPAGGRGGIPEERGGLTGETAGLTGDTTGMTGERTGMTGERAGMTGGMRGGMTGDLTGDRDIEMTRSEEQLHIGKESRESGRVRLHKYVETENVQQTIPLSHEEVVIEREPIRDGDMTGPHEIHGEDREMILHEERAVVGKETKPVERIHVRKQDVQHEETVEGQVRRERLEIDEEGVTRDDKDEPFGHDGGLPPTR